MFLVKKNNSGGCKISLELKKYLEKILKFCEPSYSKMKNEQKRFVVKWQIYNEKGKILYFSCLFTSISPRRGRTGSAQEGALSPVQK